MSALNYSLILVFLLYLFLILLLLYDRLKVLKFLCIIRGLYVTVDNVRSFVNPFNAENVKNFRRICAKLVFGVCNTSRM